MLQGMMWAYAFGAVAVVSAVSFVGAVTLFFRDSFLKRMIFVLVGLAVGALFGDALVHLIPSAFSSGIGDGVVGLTVMAGILLFFSLEKFLSWHHCHGECEETRDTMAVHDHRPRVVGHLILAADFVHNAVDGVLIGASFLVSVPVGIATTVAVVLHEIPQEIADFGILIHSGWSRAKALLWNFFSALSAFLGVFIILLFGGRVENLAPLAAAFTAGAFIYIAGSDLVPELHKTTEPHRTFLQFIAIIIGFLLMLLLALFE